MSATAIRDANFINNCKNCPEPTASIDVCIAMESRGVGLMKKKSKVMGHSFELLPVAERVQQYREMADATFLKAQRVEDPGLKTQYLNMASSWHALAQELEAGNPDPEIIPPAQVAALNQRQEES